METTTVCSDSHMNHTYTYKHWGSNMLFNVKSSGTHSFIFVSLGGVRLSSLNGLLYQPRMIDEHEAVGGMRIGRGMYVCM
jgi:hypothetical protein